MDLAIFRFWKNEVPSMSEAKLDSSEGMVMRAGLVDSSSLNCKFLIKTAAAFSNYSSIKSDGRI